MDRPQFKLGTLLRAADLNLEQRYQIEGHATANRTLHTWGIVRGLDLATVASDARLLVVQRGFALDPLGRELLLDEEITLEVPQIKETSAVAVIRYAEEPATPVANQGAGYFNARRITPFVTILPSSPGPRPNDVVLGEVVLLPPSQSITRIKLDARRYSGVAVGQIDFPSPEGQSPAKIAATPREGGLLFDARETDFFGSLIVAGSVGVGVVGPPRARLEVTGADTTPDLLAQVSLDDGQPVLVVMKNRRVGIGTIDPQQALHVAGDIGLDVDSRLVLLGAGSIGSEDCEIKFGLDSLLVTAQHTTALSSGAETQPTLMVSGDTGFVGVGTSSPTYALTVNGVIEAKDGLVFPYGVTQPDAVPPLPIGAIIDWWWHSPDDITIPLGFCICDGRKVDDPESSLNGTTVPDLRDAFVRGVVDPNSIDGQTKGSPLHTHRISKQVAEHDHPIPHVHTVGFDVKPTTMIGDKTSDGDQDLAIADHVHTVPSLNTRPADPTHSSPYTGKDDDEWETDGAEAMPPFTYLLKLMRVR